jgi:hypothetical protein
MSWLVLDTLNNLEVGSTHPNLLVTEGITQGVAIVLNVRYNEG